MIARLATPRVFALLAVAPLLLALPNEVPDVDPAQYLDVAGWIHRTGDWLNLKDSLGPFINKPPLMMWVQAGFMTVLGETDIAARLASLFFGAVMLAAIVGIGRELKDAQRGWVAAAFAASSVAFHAMVAEPKVDVAVASMTAVALWAFLRGRSRPAWLWLGWGAAGLAWLAKGPVGLALVAAALMPEGLRQAWGQGAAPLYRRIFAVRPWRGLLLVGLIVAPFYVALGRSQGLGAVDFMLFGQSIGRFTGQSGYANATTPLFYFHTALWAFAPFTPLLVHSLWRRARELLSARALPADESRVVLWWLVIPFVAISFADFKLPQYLYWLLPAAALLAAEELEQLAFAARRWHMAVQWCLGVLVTAAAMAGTWLWDFNGAVKIGWFGAPLLVFGVLAGVGWRLKDNARFVAASVAATAGLFCGWHGFFEPKLLEFQPGRELGAVIRRLDPQGTATVYLQGAAPAFSVGFYSGRRVLVTDAADIARRVRHGEVSVAVVKQGEYAALEQVGLKVEPVVSVSGFPISRLNAAFLNPSTRASTLEWLEVVRLRVKSGL